MKSPDGLSGDTNGYFTRLLKQANIPPEFTRQRLHQLEGRADVVARDMIEWALSQGTNPKDPRYTTLGSLLGPELKELGDKASTAASAICIYQLYNDAVLLGELRAQFQVPESASEFAPGPEIGPDFDWQGPANDVTLQGWLRPEPTFLDMGMVIRAADRSRSVCQIKVGTSGPMGTGVLVADDLVLTNYHVLVPTGQENINKSAAAVAVTFGNYTGSNKDGRTQLQLAERDAVVEQSPTSKLDFALLRVDRNIGAALPIKPTPIVIVTPKVKASMNILQHPEGGEMKLALSDDAVTFVDPTTGIIQYITRALAGSSGSPCFDEGWRLVALHHAERSRNFGRIREGILMSAIYPLISRHVPRVA
jgi:V8-like Glu-specific endopeptidase